MFGSASSFEGSDRSTDMESETSRDGSDEKYASFGGVGKDALNFEGTGSLKIRSSLSRRSPKNALLAERRRMASRRFKIATQVERRDAITANDKRHGITNAGRKERFASQKLSREKILPADLHNVHASGETVDCAAGALSVIDIDSPSSCIGSFSSCTSACNAEDLSAMPLVTGNADLINRILHMLPLRDRCRLRRVSTVFNNAYWLPSNWEAVHLAGSCYTDDALACIPHISIRSLRLRGACMQLTTLMLPSLTELDISHCRARPDILFAAFQSCGETLLRLDISALRLLGGCVGWQGYSALVPGSLNMQLLKMQMQRLLSLQQTLGLGAELPDDGPLTDPAVTLLAPLRKLRVLVARGVDTPVHNFAAMLQRAWRERQVAFSPTSDLEANAIPTEVIPRMWTLLAISLYCPEIEELHVGWLSEFAPASLTADAPSAAPEFSEWCLAVPRDSAQFSVRCKNLHSISLAGCVLLTDNLLLQMQSRPLISLDLCGCRRLTDQALAKFLPSSAHSLTHLNLRGTLFGNYAVSALSAAAPLKLSKLNVSCTEVNGAAMRHLAACCTELTILDMCYAPLLHADDAVASAAQHPALRKVGLGGLPGLSLEALELLLHSCHEVENLGIGGSGVAGAEALRLIANLAPGLTTLNAHKLPGIDEESVFRLCVSCSKLTSLDLYGCDIDDSVMGVLHKLRRQDQFEIFSPGEVLTVQAPIEEVSLRYIGPRALGVLSAPRQLTLTLLPTPREPSSCRPRFEF